MWSRATDVNSSTTSRRGCPRWVRRIDTTLVQLPDYGKTGAARRGRGKGDPGVWYGARVCILAHERGLVGGGESRLLFNIQTALGALQGQGAGSRSIPYVESGSPNRVKPEG